MKRLFGVLLLLTALSGCDGAPLDLAALLQSLFGGNAPPGGINSGEEPAGNPIPELGELVGVRIISESEQDADVVVRFLIGDIEVRLTELRVEALATTGVIGPDIAALVEVSGAYVDGPALQTVSLLLGQDFTEGDLIDVIIPALPDGDDACPDDPAKLQPGQCGCGVPDTDTDEDGMADCVDQCPADSGKVAPGVCGCGSPDIDTDGDAVLDCLDQCPNDPGKLTPGVCGCGVADVDSDEDGTLDCLDECPEDSGKVTPGVCGCGIPDSDGDQDGTLDCEDGCPDDSGKTEPGSCGCGVPDSDSDGDDTPDCLDLCPEDPNKTEPGTCGCGVADVDSDEDGALDCNDDCPGDPDKIEPGVCGCGVPDEDVNGDQIPDCVDLCVDDPDKVAPGVCGCGTPDTDSDEDGIFDCNDGCPEDEGKTEPGICGCGVSDADSDGDKTPNCNDGCPADPNKVNPGVCGCGVPDTDTDGDQTPNCNDGCPADPNKVSPGICGCGVPDTDTDGDQTPNCNDGCPADPNKVNPGICGCGVPDSPLDEDEDGVLDCIDVCPFGNDLEDCNDNGVPDDCDDARRLYWTAQPSTFGQVASTLIDGDCPEDVLRPFETAPGSIDLDLAVPGSEWMYWMNSNIIQRANLAGSFSGTVMTLTEDVFGGLAVDQPTRDIFWTELYNTDGEYVYVYGFDPDTPGEPFPNFLTSVSGRSPGGVAVNTQLGVLYWTQVDPETDAGQIYLIDPNASDASTFSVVAAVGPLPVGGPGILIPDVALDPAAQQIFWIENTAQAGSRIRRGTLTGEPLQPDPLIDLGDEAGGRLALDLQQRKIYWSTLRSGTINRADIDGTDVQLGFIGVSGPTIDIVVKPEGIAVPPPQVSRAVAPR